MYSLLYISLSFHVRLEFVSAETIDGKVPLHMLIILDLKEFNQVLSTVRELARG